VLVLFAADHCGYCERLEADYLGPMSGSEEYSDKVIIRKVLIDSYYSIRDFSGKTLSGDKLASQYGVHVTPTVIVFDNSGEALAKKLIGYNGSEYYGWDLDKAINGAVARLKKI
jgi:thioredoxin-related protein